ncbi:CapA family protein [Nocardioides speluncae]|uniref:CapA family protein n=1 Tax=Nocardioides speluncae TaxID=2670337 RepID=UPI00137A4862|nr:CapA family protein [Nocardioides speluncae]
MRNPTGWVLAVAGLALVCVPAAVYAALIGNSGKTGPEEVPSASVSPTAAQGKPRPTKVTIALTGDVLAHDTLFEVAADNAERKSGARQFDFRPMLKGLRPVVAEADLAICHLETPLAPKGGPYSGYPQFSVPPQLAADLEDIGYDACSTASNHSVDQGFDGVTTTLDALDRAGLVHTGTARSRAEADQPTVLEAEGMRIGWLSYTFGTNGLPVDSDKPWSVNLIDPDRIIADAKQARAEGADAVLVALHWGDEYATEPSSYQTEIAEQLTKSKAITMVYGHHAHVVQPVEKVNGTWVVYGLGNSLAKQETEADGVNDGLVAIVTLTQRGERQAKVSKLVTRRTVIEHDLPPYGETRVRLTGGPQRP